MNFRKYNAFMVALLVLIVSVCVLACKNNIPSSTSPSGSDASVGTNGISIQDNGSDTQSESVPRFSNAWSTYNYANNIMNTGKGWFSQTTQSCEAMKFTQSVNIDRWCDNNGKAMMQSTCSGAVSFFECLFMDSESVTNRRYDGGVAYGTIPNFVNSARTISKSAFKNERGVLPAAFPHTIAKRTARAIGFVCDGSVYKFRMVLNEEASKDYEVQVNYLSGSSTWPVIDYVYMDYVVDVKTGYFLKSIKYEKYNITMFGLPCTTTSVSTEIYKKMNVSIDISKPDYLGL